MHTQFSSFYHDHPMGESATGAIAHFAGTLALLLLLAKCSLRCRRAYPAHRQNAHSHLSNYGI